MAKMKRIGEGRNAFSVLQSDFDKGFDQPQTAVWHGTKMSMQDSHNIRKEVARIEGLREIKIKVNKGKVKNERTKNIKNK